MIVGGQVGIADHVRIESGAILGAQSGIPSKKVIRGKGIVFWGTPARPIKEYLKERGNPGAIATKERCTAVDVAISRTTRQPDDWLPNSD